MDQERKPYGPGLNWRDTPARSAPAMASSGPKPLTPQQVQAHLARVRHAFQQPNLSQVDRVRFSPDRQLLLNLVQEERRRRLDQINTYTSQVGEPHPELKPRIESATAHTAEFAVQLLELRFRERLLDTQAMDEAFSQTSGQGILTPEDYRHAVRQGFEAAFQFQSPQVPIPTNPKWGAPGSRTGVTPQLSGFSSIATNPAWVRPVGVMKDVAYGIGRGSAVSATGRVSTPAGPPSLAQITEAGKAHRVAMNSPQGVIDSHGNKVAMARAQAQMENIQESYRIRQHEQRMQGIPQAARAVSDPKQIKGKIKDLTGQIDGLTARLRSPGEGTDRSGLRRELEYTLSLRNAFMERYITTPEGQAYQARTDAQFMSKTFNEPFTPEAARGHAQEIVNLIQRSHNWAKDAHAISAGGNVWTVAERNPELKPILVRLGLAAEAMPTDRNQALALARKIEERRKLLFGNTMVGSVLNQGLSEADYRQAGVPVPDKPWEKTVKSAFTAARENAAAAAARQVAARVAARKLGALDARPDDVETALTYMANVAALYQPAVESIKGGSRNYTSPQEAQFTEGRSEEWGALTVAHQLKRHLELRASRSIDEILPQGLQRDPQYQALRSQLEKLEQERAYRARQGLRVAGGQIPGPNAAGGPIVSTPLQREGPLDPGVHALDQQIQATRAALRKLSQRDAAHSQTQTTGYAAHATRSRPTQIMDSEVQHLIDRETNSGELLFGVEYNPQTGRLEAKLDEGTALNAQRMIFQQIADREMRNIEQAKTFWQRNGRLPWTDDPSRDIAKVKEAWVAAQTVRAGQLYRAIKRGQIDWQNALNSAERMIGRSHAVTTAADTERYGDHADEYEGDFEDRQQMTTQWSGTDPIWDVHPMRSKQLGPQQTEQQVRAIEEELLPKAARLKQLMDAVDSAASPQARTDAQQRLMRHVASFTRQAPSEGLLPIGGRYAAVARFGTGAEGEFRAPFFGEQEARILRSLRRKDTGEMKPEQLSAHNARIDELVRAEELQWEKVYTEWLEGSTNAKSGKTNREYQALGSARDRVLARDQTILGPGSYNVYDAWSALASNPMKAHGDASQLFNMQLRGVDSEKIPQAGAWTQFNPILGVLRGQLQSGQRRDTPVIPTGNPNAVSIGFKYMEDRLSEFGIAPGEAMSATGFLSIMQGAASGLSTAPMRPDSNLPPSMYARFSEIEGKVANYPDALRSIRGKAFDRIMDDYLGNLGVAGYQDRNTLYDQINQIVRQELGHDLDVDTMFGKGERRVLEPSVPSLGLGGSFDDFSPADTAVLHASSELARAFFPQAMLSPAAQDKYAQGSRRYKGYAQWADAAHKAFTTRTGRSLGSLEDLQKAAEGDTAARKRYARDSFTNRLPIHLTLDLAHGILEWQNLASGGPLQRNTRETPALGLLRSGMIDPAAEAGILKMVRDEQHAEADHLFTTLADVARENPDVNWLRNLLIGKDPGTQEAISSLHTSQGPPSWAPAMGRMELAAAFNAVYEAFYAGSRPYNTSDVSFDKDGKASHRGDYPRRLAAAHMQHDYQQRLNRNRAKGYAQNYTDQMFADWQAAGGLLGRGKQSAPYETFLREWGAIPLTSSALSGRGVSEAGPGFGIRGIQTTADLQRLAPLARWAVESYRAAQAGGDFAFDAIKSAGLMKALGMDRAVAHHSFSGEQLAEMVAQGLDPRREATRRGLDTVENVYKRSQAMGRVKNGMLRVQTESVAGLPSSSQPEGRPFKGGKKFAALAQLLFDASDPRSVMGTIMADWRSTAKSLPGAPPVWSPLPEILPGAIRESFPDPEKGMISAGFLDIIRKQRAKRSYFRGTSYHPGGPAFIHAGEIAIDPRGRTAAFGHDAYVGKLPRGSRVLSAGELRGRAYATGGEIPLNRYSYPPVDANVITERSQWLMDLFKHMYGGRLFGTNAEPGIGGERYAQLPAGMRQADPSIQHYMPGLSYTQGQIDALSRGYGSGYAPHVLIGPAGAGKSTTDRSFVFQEFKSSRLPTGEIRGGKAPSQLPRFVSFARVTVADFERQLRKIADDPMVPIEDKMTNAEIDAYVDSGGIRTIHAMAHDFATKLIGLDELFGTTRREADTAGHLPKADDLGAYSEYASNAWKLHDLVRSHPDLVEIDASGAYVLKEGSPFIGLEIMNDAQKIETRREAIYELVQSPEFQSDVHGLRSKNLLPNVGGVARRGRTRDVADITIGNELIDRKSDRYRNLWGLEANRSKREIELFELMDVLEQTPFNPRELITIFDPETGSVVRDPATGRVMDFRNRDWWAAAMALDKFDEINQRGTLGWVHQEGKSSQLGAIRRATYGDLIRYVIDYAQRYNADKGDNAAFARLAGLDQHRFIVGEGQDANLGEMLLVKMAAGSDGNLVLSLDPNQALFEYKGSMPMIGLEAMESAREGGTFTFLGEQYRFGPEHVQQMNEALRSLKGTIDVPGSGPTSPFEFMLGPQTVGTGPDWGLNTPVRLPSLTEGPDELGQWDHERAFAVMATSLLMARDPRTVRLPWQAEPFRDQIIAEAIEATQGILSPGGLWPEQFLAVAPTNEMVANMIETWHEAGIPAHARFADATWQRWEGLSSSIEKVFPNSATGNAELEALVNDESRNALEALYEIDTRTGKTHGRQLIEDLLDPESNIGRGGTLFGLEYRLGTQTPYDKGLRDGLREALQARRRLSLPSENRTAAAGQDPSLMRGAVAFTPQGAKGLEADEGFVLGFSERHYPFETASTISEASEKFRTAYGALSRTRHSFIVGSDATSGTGRPNPALRAFQDLQAGRTPEYWARNQSYHQLLANYRGGRARPQFQARPGGVPPTVTPAGVPPTTPSAPLTAEQQLRKSMGLSYARGGMIGGAQNVLVGEGMSGYGGAGEVIVLGPNHGAEAGTYIGVDQPSLVGLLPGDRVLNQAQMIERGVRLGLGVQGKRSRGEAAAFGADLEQILKSGIGYTGGKDVSAQNQQAIRFTRREDAEMAGRALNERLGIAYKLDGNDLVIGTGSNWAARLGGGLLRGPIARDVSAGGGAMVAMPPARAEQLLGAPGLGPAYGGQAGPEFGHAVGAFTERIMQLDHATGNLVDTMERSAQTIERTAPKLAGMTWTQSQAEHNRQVRAAVPGLGPQAVTGMFGTVPELSRGAIGPSYMRDAAGNIQHQTDRNNRPIIVDGQRRAVVAPTPQAVVEAILSDPQTIGRRVSPAEARNALVPLSHQGVAEQYNLAYGQQMRGVTRTLLAAGGAETMPPATTQPGMIGAPVNWGAGIPLDAAGQPGAMPPIPGRPAQPPQHGIMAQNLPAGGAGGFGGGSQGVGMTGPPGGRPPRGGAPQSGAAGFANSMAHFANAGAFWIGMGVVDEMAQRLAEGRQIHEDNTRTAAIFAAYTGKLAGTTDELTGQVLGVRDEMRDAFLGNEGRLVGAGILTPGELTRRAIKSTQAGLIAPGEALEGEAGRTIGAGGISPIDMIAMTEIGAEAFGTDYERLAGYLGRTVRRGGIGEGTTLGRTGARREMSPEEQGEAARAFAGEMLGGLFAAASVSPLSPEQVFTAGERLIPEHSEFMSGGTAPERLRQSTGIVGGFLAQGMQLYEMQHVLEQLDNTRRMQGTVPQGMLAARTLGLVTGGEAGAGRLDFGELTGGVTGSPQLAQTILGRVQREAAEVSAEHQIAQMETRLTGRLPGEMVAGPTGVPTQAPPISYTRTMADGQEFTFTGDFAIDAKAADVQIERADLNLRQSRQSLDARRDDLNAGWSVAAFNQAVLDANAEVISFNQPMQESQATILGFQQQAQTIRETMHTVAQEAFPLQAQLLAINEQIQPMQVQAASYARESLELTQQMLPLQERATQLRASQLANQKAITALDRERYEIEGELLEIDRQINEKRGERQDVAERQQQLREEAIPIQRQAVALQAEHLPFQQEQYAIQGQILQLGENAIAIEGEAIAAHKETLSIQQNLLDMQDQALALQGKQLDQAQVTLQLQQQLIPMQEQQLGLQQQAFASSSAAQQAGFAVNRASLAESARSTQAQLAMLPMQERVMNLQQEIAWSSLQRQQQSVASSRWFEDLMYGKPGKDQSFAGYEQRVAKEQTQNNQSSLTSGLASSVDVNSPTGLANQMTYRTIQHQQAQLMYGQSSLSSAQAYNETMDYLDFQISFAEEQAKAEAKVRAEQRKFQDQSFKEQEKLLKAQEKLQDAQMEERKKSLQAQLEIIRLQEQSLAAQEAAAADQRALQEHSLEMQAQQLEISKSQMAERELGQDAARQAYEMALETQKLSRSRLEEEQIAMKQRENSFAEMIARQDLAWSNWEEGGVTLREAANALAAAMNSQAQSEAATEGSAIDTEIGELTQERNDIVMGRLADIARERERLALNMQELGDMMGEVNLALEGLRNLQNVIDVLRGFTQLDIGDLQLDASAITNDVNRIYEVLRILGSQAEGFDLQAAHEEVYNLQVLKNKQMEAGIRLEDAQQARNEAKQSGDVDNLINAEEALALAEEDYRQATEDYDSLRKKTELAQGQRAQAQLEAEDDLIYAREIAQSQADFNEAQRIFEEGGGIIHPDQVNILKALGHDFAVDETGSVGVDVLLEEIVAQGITAKELTAAGLPGAIADFASLQDQFDPETMRALTEVMTASSIYGMDSEEWMQRIDASTRETLGANQEKLADSAVGDWMQARFGDREVTPERLGAYFNSMFGVGTDAGGFGGGLAVGGETIDDIILGGLLAGKIGQTKPGQKVMGGLGRAGGAIMPKTLLGKGIVGGGLAGLAALLLTGAVGAEGLYPDPTGGAAGFSPLGLMGNIGIGALMGGGMFGLPGAVIGGVAGAGLTAYEQRDRIGKYLNETFGLEGEILGGLPTQIGKLITGDMSVFADFFAKIEELAGALPEVPTEVWDTLGALFADLTTWAKNTAQWVGDHIGDPVMETLRQVWDEFWRHVGEFADWLGQHLPSGDEVRVGIGDFFQFLGDFVGAAISWLEQRDLISQIGSFFGWLGNLKDSIIIWLDDNDVVGHIGNFFGWLGGLKDNIIAWLDENDVITHVGNFFGWLGGLKDNVMAWLEEHKETIARVGDFFGWLGGLKDAALAWVEQHQETIAQVGEWLGWIGNFALTFGGWVAEKGAAVMTGIQSFFDFLGQFPTWVDEQLRKIPGYEALVGGETTAEGVPVGLPGHYQEVYEGGTRQPDPVLGVEQMGVDNQGVQPVGGAGYSRPDSILGQMYQKHLMEQQIALEAEQVALLRSEAGPIQSFPDQRTTPYDPSGEIQSFPDARLTTTATPAPTLTTTDSILRAIYTQGQETNLILRGIASAIGAVVPSLATTVPTVPTTLTPGIFPATTSTLGTLGSSIASQVQSALGLGSPVAALGAAPAVPGVAGTVPSPGLGGVPVYPTASPAPVSSHPMSTSSGQSGSSYLRSLLPDVPSAALDLLARRNPGAAAMMRGDLSLTNPSAAALLRGDLSMTNPNAASLLPIAMQMAPWLADMLPSFMRGGAPADSLATSLPATTDQPMMLPDGTMVDLATGAPMGMAGMRGRGVGMRGRGAGLRARGEALRSKLMAKANAIRAKFGMPIPSGGGGGGRGSDGIARSAMAAALTPTEMSEEEFLQIVRDNAPAGQETAHLLTAYELMNVTPPADLVQRAQEEELLAAKQAEFNEQLQIISQTAPSNVQYSRTELITEPVVTQGTMTPMTTPAGTPTTIPTEEILNARGYMNPQTLATMGIGAPQGTIRTDVVGFGTGSSWDNYNAYDEIFVAYGNMFGIDPAILKGMAIVENGGTQSIAGPGGVTGLMQVQPIWQSEADRLKLPPVNTPEGQIAMAAAILSGKASLGAPTTPGDWKANFRASYFPVGDGVDPHSGISADAYLDAIGVLATDIHSAEAQGLGIPSQVAIDPSTVPSKVTGHVRPPWDAKAIEEAIMTTPGVGLHDTGAVWGNLTAEEIAAFEPSMTAADIPGKLNGPGGILVGEEAAPLPVWELLPPNDPLAPKAGLDETFIEGSSRRIDPTPPSSGTTTVPINGFPNRADDEPYNVAGPGVFADISGITGGEGYISQGFGVTPYITGPHYGGDYIDRGPGTWTHMVGTPDQHDAYDIGSDLGTTLYAPISGTVVGTDSVIKGLDPVTGQRIQDSSIYIMKPDGDIVAMGHMLAVNDALTYGTEIKAGEVVGLSGSPFAGGTGAHTHVSYLDFQGTPEELAALKAQMNAQGDALMPGTDSKMSAAGYAILAGLGGNLDRYWQAIPLSEGMTDADMQALAGISGYEELTEATPLGKVEGYRPGDVVPGLVTDDAVGGVGSSATAAFQQTLPEWDPNAAIQSFPGATAGTTSGAMGLQATPPPPFMLPPEVRDPARGGIFMPGPPRNWFPGSTHVPVDGSYTDINGNMVYTYPTNPMPVDPRLVPGSPAYNNLLVTTPWGELDPDGVRPWTPGPVNPVYVPGNVNYGTREYIPPVSPGLGAGGVALVPSELYGGLEDSFFGGGVISHPAEIETIRPGSGLPATSRYTDYLPEGTRVRPANSTWTGEDFGTATIPREAALARMELGRQRRSTLPLKGLFGGGELTLDEQLLALEQEEWALSLERLKQQKPVPLQGTFGDTGIIDSNEYFGELTPYQPPLKATTPGARSSSDTIIDAPQRLPREVTLIPHATLPRDLGTLYPIQTSVESFPDSSQPNQGGYYETTPGYYETTTQYMEVLPEYDPAAPIQSFPDDRLMNNQYGGYIPGSTYVPPQDRGMEYTTQPATGHYESQIVGWEQVWVPDTTGTAPANTYQPGEPGYYQSQEAGAAQTGHYEDRPIYGDVYVEDTPAQTVPVTNTTYVPGQTTYIPGTPAGTIPAGALATTPGGYIPGISNGSIPGIPAGFGTTGSTIPAGPQLDQMKAIWGSFAGTPAGDIALGVLGGTYNQQTGAPSIVDLSPVAVNPPSGPLSTQAAKSPLTGGLPQMGELPPGFVMDPGFYKPQPQDPFAPRLPVYETTPSLDTGFGPVTPEMVGAALGVGGAGMGGAGGPYDATINQYAEQFGVDPGVLHEMMMIESGGDPNAYRASDGYGGGASIGLMQVKPDIWEPVAQQLGLPSTYTPEGQIAMAAAILGGAPGTGGTPGDWQGNFTSVFFPADDANGTTQQEYLGRLQAAEGTMGTAKLTEATGLPGAAVPMEVPVEPVATMPDGTKPFPGRGIPVDVPVEPGVGLGTSGLPGMTGMPNGTDLANQILGSMGMSTGGNLLPGAIVPVGTFNGKTQMPGQGVPLITSDPLGTRYTGTPGGLWDLHKRHMLDPDSPIRLGANIALRNQGGSVISTGGQWVAGLSPAESDAMYGSNLSGRNRLSTMPALRGPATPAPRGGAAPRGLAAPGRGAPDVSRGLTEGLGRLGRSLASIDRTAANANRSQLSALRGISGAITKGEQQQARGLASLGRQTQTAARGQQTELRRIATETRRGNVETRRVATETRRVASETRRVGSETRRVASETRRVASETRHVATDTRKLSPEIRKLDPEIRKVDKSVQKAAQAIGNIRFPNIRMPSSGGTRVVSRGGGGGGGGRGGGGRGGGGRGGRLGGLRGHAAGDRDVEEGLALVGEAGPELVDFKGGERVYNHGELRHLVDESKLLARHGREGARLLRRAGENHRLDRSSPVSITPQLDARMSGGQSSHKQVNVNLTFNGARAIDEKAVKGMLDKTVAEIHRAMKEP